MGSYDEAAERGFELADRVQSSLIEGEVVLLDLKRGVYLGLDEVGTRVWQLLGENNNVEVIIERLHEEYGVPLERIRTDVFRFVQELLDRGVLKLRSGNERGRHGDGTSQTLCKQPPKQS